MVREKAGIRRRYRRSVGKRILDFLETVSFWLTVAAIAALSFTIWQWQAVSLWVRNAVSLIWELFGFGLISLFLAGIILAAALSAHKSALRRLSRLLGFFALLTAVWGVLGYFGLGGTIGTGITGGRGASGILRLAALTSLGIILLAPETVWHLLENIASGLASRPRGFKIAALFLVLLGLGLTLFFWQRTAINAWGNELLNSIWNAFGWGLALIAIALVIAVTTIKRRQISDFVEMLKSRNLIRWLGGLVLTLALWGLLALFSRGGSIGELILGKPPSGVSAVPRVVGLFILGLILLIPRLLTGLLGLIPGLGNILREKLPPGYPIPEVKLARKPLKKEAPPVAGKSILPPPVPEIPKAAEEAPPSTPSQPQELRQVAQEVWKKYGESGEAVVEGGWKLPPLDILDKVAELEFSEADNLNRARMIEEALGSYGVESKVVQINVGPTVTQFGIEPGWDRKMRGVREKDREGNVRTRTEEVARTRVKVERITSLANDLALALAAPSIRIEAPVPGKSVVGIEVPNTVFGVVSLRSVIESPSFQKIKAKSRLTLALGKGAGGEAGAADLAKMPHLLIAGTTGSGKTVCLNSIICCLLLQNTPDDVRFIMVDPKRVELTLFDGIPHMAVPVIVDAKRAIGILRWLNQEMDSRYKKIALEGVRNIEGYNKNRTGKERMPYLILVIDELADLMMTAFEEVEHILCRLAQLARATGIHLVVATQRPSVDVVTGLIKANFPTRISFAVTSQVDSRTILDTVGAEKLLGRGDMLYMPTDATKPKRLQGCIVSEAETERLVYFWGKQKERETPTLNVAELVSSGTLKKTAGYGDPLLERAKQLAGEHDSISVSYLQRQLHIGYNRAARLLEELEAEGKKEDTETA